MRVVILLTIIFSLQVIAFSQSSHTNPERDLFSGTWVLNKKKSTPNYISDNVKWIISVDDDEIHIEKIYSVNKKPYKYSLTLFADNRGEKNIVPAVKDIPDQTIISKTKWDKNKIIRRYKGYSYPTPLFTTKWAEKIDLSKDHNQLIVESRVISSDFPNPNGQMSIPRKGVFDREN